MILIGYLLWVGFAVFISYSIAVRGEKRSSTRNVSCAMLATVLIALPFWDAILGAPTFNRLCKDHAGLVRHEQTDFPLTSVSIANHPSDRCTQCFILLLMGAATETQAEFHDRPHAQALTDRIGSIRYRLAASSDPACAPFFAAFPHGYDDLWRSPTTLNDGGTCIVGEPISEISADYELTGPTVADDRRGIVALRTRRVELRLRDADRPLAALTLLMHRAWIARKTGSQPLRSCPTFTPPRESDNFDALTLTQKLMEEG